MSEDNPYPPFPELPKIVASVLKYLLADNDVEDEHDFEYHTERDNIAMAAQELVRRVNAMEERHRPYWWKATPVEELEGKVARLESDCTSMRASLDRQHAALRVYFKHTEESPLTEERRKELGAVLEHGQYPRHPSIPTEAVEAVGRSIGKLWRTFDDAGWRGEVIPNTVVTGVAEHLDADLDLPPEFIAAFREGRGERFAPSHGTPEGGAGSPG